MVRKTKEDAVSPVIGIMLMLVVTIIIAGTVTLFATSILGDTDNMAGTSITKVKFVGLETAGIEILKNTENAPLRDEVGLVFEVVSGDSIDMRNLKLILDDHNLRGGGSAGLVEVSYNLFLRPSWNKDAKGTATLPEKYFNEKNPVRFVPYPVPDKISTGDTMIEPGEKFIILAEYVGYTNFETYKWDAGTFGYAGTILGESSAYASGGYSMSSSVTELTLIDTSTGNVLLNCHLTDGVLI